jgi:hypothetical protein
MLVGAGLMLRSKLKFGFVNESNVLMLNRNGLAKTGLAVAKVKARAADPGPGEVAGISVRLDGDAPQDKTPADDMNKNPLSAGQPVYNFYSVETVQRIGYDSFTPDNGVLIAKNKDKEGNTCGYNCFTWVIDAHPEDIKQVDFKRPNGDVVMRTVADYRQLNDALFHAGLNSGSQYEWEDTPNRLHFYVIDVQKDEKGFLSYTVGVKSLDGAGPQKRGVALAVVPGSRVSGAVSHLNFKLTNTGAAAETEASAHPQNAAAFLGSDVYRLSLAVEGKGWEAKLQNALAAVKFGDSVNVPVYVSRGAGASTGTLKVTATSESDPTKTMTATYKLTAK